MRNLVRALLMMGATVALIAGAGCSSGGSSSSEKGLTVPTLGQSSGAGGAPGPSLVLESPSASSVAPPTQQPTSELPKTTTQETTKKSPPPPACEKWTAEAKKSPSETIIQSRLTDAQILGTDKCFDRVEFVINGVSGDPKNLVSFVADWSNGPLTADPNGAPISLKGTILKVVIRAPAQGYANSGPPEEQRMKVDGQLPGKGRVVRDARFAGSFESVSLFGIGLDKQRPFNVTAGVVDGKTHVWVDIAIS